MAKKIKSTEPSKSEKIIAMAEKVQELLIDSYNEQDRIKYYRAIIDLFKEHITPKGWPTISEVGAMASRCAWFIAYCADHDVEFQKFCLMHMKKCKHAEIDQTQIARLHDRICINRNHEQLYGTQHIEISGKIFIAAIENIEHVNSRRVFMGLKIFSQRQFKRIVTFPASINN